MLDKNDLINISADLNSLSNTIDSACNRIPVKSFPKVETIKIIPPGFTDSSGIWVQEDYEIIDDIFRSFSGKVFVWAFNNNNNNWEPIYLESIRIHLPIESNIYKMLEKLERTKKLERILKDDE